MGSGIFADSSMKPGDKELSAALKRSYPWWLEIKQYVLDSCPAAIEEWNFSKSFGWSARIKDNRRVLIYMMPGLKYFKASFVFGAKATEEAMSCGLQENIKDIIRSAKIFAEGKGFRIDVDKSSLVNDIKKIIDIKLSH